MAARCWPRRVVDLSAALNALEFIVKIRGVEREFRCRKKSDQLPLSPEREMSKVSDRFYAERQVRAKPPRRRMREQQVRTHSFISTTLAPNLKKHQRINQQHKYAKERD